MRDNLYKYTVDMTPIGHIGLTSLVGVYMLNIIPETSSNQLLLPLVLGGIAPDLDLFYSMYKKGTKVLDRNAGEHRYYFTHTPIFLLSLSFLIALANFEFGIYFAIGTMLHLLLDTLFFPEGINFTFPFSRKRTTFFEIKPGKSFLAKEPIAKVDNWKGNYLKTPLFWIFEIFPTLLAFTLVTRIVYKS